MKKVIIPEYLVESVQSGRKIGYHSTSSELHHNQILHKRDEDKELYLDKSYEQLLEDVRQEFFNDRISRFNAVFSSPYPKNRFTHFGYVYKVEIIGNNFYADSHIIDELFELSSTYLYGYNNFSKEDQLYLLKKKKNIVDLCKQYWYGKLNNKKSIEILSEKIKIIELYIPQDGLYSGGTYQKFYQV